MGTIYHESATPVKSTNRAKLDLTGGAIVAPERILPKGARAGEVLPMDAQACRQYVKEMRIRYKRATRVERGRLLDEVAAVTGYHRKYAIMLLGNVPLPRTKPPGRPTRITDEGIDALVKIWQAANYPWSVRLVAMLPTWMPYARKHFPISEDTAQLVLGLSARSIDRMLHPHRTALKRRLYGRTKPGTLLKHQIPIRTERWDTTQVGWCETDTVAHCGESGYGEFASSVNLTDVASTWTETRAVLGKGQRFVVEVLEEMRQSFPFALRGIDSDSGSEFINHHCYDWTRRNALQFTRGRPYRKNDNAYVEQKNWTHVRKIFGWKRIDTPQAVQAMNELYRNELRLFMNYFQPSVKLRERTRIGSRTTRKYDTPKTPFERLLDLEVLSADQLAAMQSEREQLDPIALSKIVEEKVEQILRMRSSSAPQRPVPQNRRSPAGFLFAHREVAFKATAVRSKVAR